MPAADTPPTPYVAAPLARGWRARFAAWALRRGGWRVVLARPVPMRCVVVFYPHTSNWDFPVGLMAKWMVDDGEDMARIAAFYADKTARRPELAGPIRLGGGA